MSTGTMIAVAAALVLGAGTAAVAVINYEANAPLAAFAPQRLRDPRLKPRHDRGFLFKADCYYFSRHRGGVGKYEARRDLDLFGSRLECQS